MPNINDIKATWNNIVTRFTALKMDVTDTNSASGSKLIDLQVGGVNFAADLDVLVQAELYIREV